MTTESGWEDAALALSKEDEDAPYVVERISDLLWRSMRELHGFHRVTCTSDPDCRIRLAAIAFAEFSKQKAAGLVEPFFELTRRDEGEMRGHSWPSDIANLEEGAMPFLAAKIGGGPFVPDSDKILALSVIMKMGEMRRRVPSARAVVDVALSDKHDEVRESAVYALSRIGRDDPETLTVLGDLANSDGSEKVKAAAKLEIARLKMPGAR